MEYQAHRLEQGRRPVTINAEIATLGLVFRWAVKQGRLSAFPRTTPIPVRPARVVIPSPEEVVRIIRALPERLKPLVWFLAETGCRKGEAINLTWDYVDLTGGYVEIASREGWSRPLPRRVQQSGLHGLFGLPIGREGHDGRQGSRAQQVRDRVYLPWPIERNR